MVKSDATPCYKLELPVELKQEEQQTCVNSLFNTLVDMLILSDRVQKEYITTINFYSTHIIPY